MMESKTVDFLKLEGRRIGNLLGEYAAVAVVGADGEAAAQVALGIAEQQSRERRVAIGDMVGEVDPIQLLVPADVVHGLVDSFVHGVSLNRFAYPLGTSGQIFVLQSGSGPIDYEAILRDDRWRRLAAGFREVGALLLVVVPDSAPGIDALIRMLGGAVTVGAARISGDLPVIAQVGDDATRAEEPTVVEGEADASALRREWARTPSDAAELLRERSSAHVPVRDRGYLGAWIAISLGVVLGVGAVLGWVYRDRLTKVAAPATAAAAVDSSAALDTQTDPGEVVNPGDSASASGWVVVIANVSDSADAHRRLLRTLGEMPAHTFTPDAPWYRISVGSFENQIAADSLLRKLRNARTLEPESGYVLYAPYSLLIADSLDQRDAEATLLALEARGVPAFPLKRSDERIAVFTGAFERAEQAASALDALAADSLLATVAYRVGRYY